MQAYLDSIKAKTGLNVDDFSRLTEEKGLSSYKDVMGWLKDDIGLGHGHATLIAQLLTKRDEFLAPQPDKFAALFSGPKAHWRAVYDNIAKHIADFGPDVGIHANRTYINLQRAGRKFGLIQPSTANRLDLGLKLKSVPPSDVMELAGTWNLMVTHRIQVPKGSAVPAETLGWLRAAYDAC
jgi:hypothetical protein